MTIVACGSHQAVSGCPSTLTVNPNRHNAKAFAPATIHVIENSTIQYCIVLGLGVRKSRVLRVWLGLGDKESQHPKTGATRVDGTKSENGSPRVMKSIDRKAWVIRMSRLSSMTGWAVAARE